MSEPTIATRSAATTAAATAPGHPPSGMVEIPGGTFLMGSDGHYPEEAPAHRVTVGGFWMDRCAVTNVEFRRFVDATRYVTLAERPPDPETYPDARPEMMVPASTVFQQPKHRVDLRNQYNWWMWVRGASWRHPPRPAVLAPGPRAAPGRPRGMGGRRGLRPCGPARSCPPKPSGSSGPGVASTVPSTHGATSSPLAAGSWRTPGTASSRSTTSSATATSTRHRSARFRPTAMACSR